MENIIKDLENYTSLLTATIEKLKKEANGFSDLSPTERAVIEAMRGEQSPTVQQEAPKPKRKRRTKAEIEAEKKNDEQQLDLPFKADNNTPPVTQNTEVPAELTKEKMLEYGREIYTKYTTDSMPEFEKIAKKYGKNNLVEIEDNDLTSVWQDLADLENRLGGKE